MPKTTQFLSEQELEIFALRLLPEIKKYFNNEEVKEEFSEWKAKQYEIKDKSEQ